MPHLLCVRILSFSAQTKLVYYNQCDSITYISKMQSNFTKKIVLCLFFQSKSRRERLCVVTVLQVLLVRTLSSLWSMHMTVYPNLNRVFLPHRLSHDVKTSSVITQTLSHSALRRLGLPPFDLSSRPAKTRRVSPSQRNAVADSPSREPTIRKTL